MELWGFTWNLYELVWTYVDKYGIMWIHMELCGLIWNEYGLNRTVKTGGFI